MCTSVEMFQSGVDQSQLEQAVIEWRWKLQVKYI